VGFADAYIVRFDIPVVDALILQKHSQLQQFIAEAADEVQGRAGLLLFQQMREAVLAGAFHQQSYTSGHFQGVDPLHDVGVAEFGKHLALRGQAVVVGGIERDLKHPFGFRAIPPNQQNIRTRSLAQASHHGKTTV